MKHEAALHFGENPKSASVLCVVIHGRTQSPEAMMEWIVTKLDARGVAFVLPRARNNSWYNAKAVDPLTDQTRNELFGSLEYLTDIVSVLRNVAGASKPLLLVGFSQGACLALEYAFRNGPWDGSLACFTGCRVGVPDDGLPSKDLQSMPVYLTGSDNDPWIPVLAFANAVEALGKSRALLRAELFPGRDHSVGSAEIEVLSEMLNGLKTNQSKHGLGHQ